MTHPLDQAINNATLGDPTLTPLECIPESTPSEWLYYLTQSAAETFFHDQRRIYLATIARDTCEWLQTLGATDPWLDMRDEYDQLYTSHKTPVALDNPTLTDKTRYLRMIAQLGKIAYPLDDGEAVTPDEMVPEIIRLGAYALAWLTHELNQEQQ